MSPVIFPDVELAVINYLRPALVANGYSTARVANSYKGSDVEVWVRRDGGPVLDATREAARVGINVFHAGDTDQPVSDLARLVSALMRAAADGNPIVRVAELSGPSPIPDTLPRRYMTFELTVRGTDL